MNTFQGLFQYRKINVFIAPVVSMHCNLYTATGTYNLDRTQMIRVATKLYINDRVVGWKTLQKYGLKIKKMKHLF